MKKVINRKVVEKYEWIVQATFYAIHYIINERFLHGYQVLELKFVQLCAKISVKGYQVHSPCVAADF